MKALVTGASGFTGGYMVRNLLEHGYAVRAFVRPQSVLSALQHLPIEFAYGDLQNERQVLDAVDGVDAVFHIAALYRAANVPDSAYWAVNVTGTANLLKAAHAVGVHRFLHCSTCGVHGDIKNPPADENAPIEPEDIYQTTKYEGEKLAHHYHANFGLPVTVVRPVGIYGPGDTRMLKLYRSIQKQRFMMFGGGQVLYHLTYVTDTVEGFRLAAENEKAVGQTYIIAGESHTTLKAFANMVAEELGVRPPQWKPPVWPLEIAAQVCEKICVPLRLQPPIYPRRVHIFTHDRAFDISKAKRELGYAPHVGMKEGVHRTANWYIEKGHLNMRKKA
ncbi:NAD-dependent epimerase/dehydratase family protein [candidate division KSB1 bacterium]|nr:NAD-dependent epimerase/dehydratase family protein [candidate division KSB1 bacterium]RQW10210.1 MAG: NAD-dependent epimerase/dehydratase family protein [candidate division KSB1 bacterium]